MVVHLVSFLLYLVSAWSLGLKHSHHFGSGLSVDGFPIQEPESILHGCTNDTYLWDWNSSDGENRAELKKFIRMASENPKSQQKLIVDKSVPGDSYSAHRQNATFLVLCRNSDLFELLDTLANIHERFNNKYGYDFTILNDVPFTDEFIYLVSNLIPRGKINFGAISEEHWSYPPHIDQEKAALVREKSAHIPYGSSQSYRHMCRYFSGFFYLHPLVSQYQYYWRIEPGVRYYCDIDYDLFAYMNSNNKKYGFVLSLFEYSDTIPTLWDHVKRYAQLYRAPGELWPLVQNGGPAQSYNLCHFWTNFEIADLSIFNNPEYAHFFNYLDSTGGFYYERWGDAPVHTLAVSLFLAKDDIHWFNNFGYYHPPYTSCPQDVNTFIANRCTCDPDDDFSYGFLSCTPHFLNVLES